MSLATRWCGLGAFALAALQPFWHAWLAPPAALPPWLVTAAGLAPIAPALVLFALRHRRAPYWAAVAALLYFCHGVMEAWSDRAVWPLALAEAALAVWIVATYGWDGMRARFGRKPAAPAA
jgi:uncharacterized membrane protein